MALSGTSADASVIYDYVGNNFTHTNGGLITTSMKVTGFVELPDALGNVFDGIVTPTSFDFHVGPIDFVRNTDATDTFFHFWTDPAGNIVNWEVYADPIQTIFFNGEVNTYNAARVFDETSGYGYADNMNDPGNWRLRSTPECVRAGMMLV